MWVEENTINLTKGFLSFSTIIFTGLIGYMFLGWAKKRSHIYLAVGVGLFILISIVLAINEFLFSQLQANEPPFALTATSVKEAYSQLETRYADTEGTLDALKSLLTSAPPTTITPEVTPTTAGITQNSMWTARIESRPLPQSITLISIAYVPPPRSGDYRLKNGQLVKINRAYWIDVTEVTRRQYSECVSSGGCTSENNPLNLKTYLSDNHPLTLVSYEDARQLCNWRGGDLPSEEEWEYAASGPSNWDFPDNVQNYNLAAWKGNKLLFPDVNSLGSLEVGVMPYDITWVGATDMLGNVIEWTKSNFSNSQNTFIVKGISFNIDGVQNFRFSYRLQQNRNQTRTDLGFRCVFEVE